jgi:ATP-binding cassette subfamily F protein 3
VERSAQAQRRRPIESRIERIEAQLAKLGAERERLETLLSSNSAYQPENRDPLREWQAEQAYTALEIERLEQEWLVQHALLEKASA